MEIITIHVMPVEMQVIDGQMENAKLWFQAPGLNIYVAGHVCKCREHSVGNLAMQETLARHIPAIALRNVRPVREVKQRVSAAQKRLF